MITITHTLQGHRPIGPDDTGEATHWRLKFTDEHRKGWTYIANDDVHIGMLISLLGRTFELGGFDRITPEMKDATKHVVGLVENHV